MTLLFSLPIVVLAFIVALALIANTSPTPFVSKDWQSQREYDRFLREHGKWHPDTPALRPVS